MKKLLILSFTLMLLFACSGQIGHEAKKAEKLSKSLDYRDWEKAVKQYEKVIQIKIEARDKQFFLYMRLGDHYLYNNMWNDALRNYEAAEKIKPNNADVYYKEGVCLSQFFKLAVDPNKKQNLLRKSINKYQTALLIEPDYTKALYGLGVLEFYFNYKQDKAVALMKRILKKQSKNTDALFALARFYYEMGNVNESLNVYKTLAKILPTKSEKLKNVENNIDRIMNEE